MNAKYNTFIGFDRNKNEDAVKVILNEESQFAFFAVSDGMGGRDIGDIAANRVNEALERIVLSKADFADKIQVLEEALIFADECLKELRLQRDRPGVAVATGIIHNNVLYFTWQGNVRIYFKRNDEWIQITTDHVLDIGYGNRRLNRCLKGEGLREDVPFKTADMTEIQEVLICTDGFYKQLESNSFDSVYDSYSSNAAFADDASFVLISLTQDC